MCLIIIREPGVVLNKKDFETAVMNNPDGWGLTVPDEDGKLFVVKDLMSDAEGLYEYIHDEFKDDLIMLHLRYTTAGETNLRNAHPFPILEHGADGVDLRMCHNGTLHQFKPKATDPNKWESDTRVFTRQFVRPLFKRLSKGMDSKEILGDRFVSDLVDDKLTAQSVVTFMDGHGNYSVVNPLGNGGYWDKDTGTYFSNKYSFDVNHRVSTNYFGGGHTMGKTQGSAKTSGAGTSTNTTTAHTPCTKFSDKFEVENEEDLFYISDLTIDKMVEESPKDSALLIKELLFRLYTKDRKLVKAERHIANKARQIKELEKKGKVDASKAA